MDHDNDVEPERAAEESLPADEPSDDEADEPAAGDGKSGRAAARRHSANKQALAAGLDARLAPGSLNAYAKYWECVKVSNAAQRNDFGISHTHSRTPAFFFFQEYAKEDDPVLSDEFITEFLIMWWQGKVPKSGPSFKVRETNAFTRVRFTGPDVSTVFRFSAQRRAVIKTLGSALHHQLRKQKALHTPGVFAGDVAEHPAMCLLKAQAQKRHTRKCTGGASDLLAGTLADDLGPDKVLVCSARRVEIRTALSLHRCPARSSWQ